MNTLFYNMKSVKKVNDKAFRLILNVVFRYIYGKQERSYMMVFIAVILMIPAALSAQSFPYDSQLTEKAVKSIEDISASIISDSFAPMTHYKAGDTTYSVVPAYFTADQLMDDPEIKGKDFRGVVIGAGGGHAVTDNLMTYFILTGMKMKGDLEYPAYGELFPAVTSSADYSLVTLLGGAGYDLLDDDIFSIPVYFGVNVQYFSADLKSDPVTWNPVPAYDVDMKTSGSGFLYGVSGGIAASAKILNKIKITPYLLYIRNFNSGSVDSEISLSQSGLTIAREKFSVDTDPVSAWMTGLNLEYIGDSGFSASVALGSMVSSLIGYGSRSTDNGVEMKSVVLIFSYNIKE